MDIKVGIICDRGLNPKRPVNQDNFLSVPEHGLFAVFDGVGGQKAGEVASHMAAETIEESLANINAGSSRELISRAIQFANRDIHELAEGNPDYRTMATTVALIHLSDNQATIAHVGDSRVYRLEDGYFYRETIDHTDINDDIRAGVTPERHPKGNVINRALGAEADVEVEIKSILLKEGARLLLCSDGIYRHLADEEIARVLSQNKDPQEAADELKRIVHARGADDNLTAIVVQLGRARISPVKGTDDGISRFLKKHTPATMPTRIKKSGKLAAREASAHSISAAAPRSRIEVDFGETKEESVWGTPSSSQFDEADTPNKSRMLIWVVVFIIGISGAFYAGYKLSEWQKGSTSKPPANDTASQIKAAREDFEKGSAAAAANILAGIVTREPQNAEARYWLGRVQFEQGEYVKARENFDEAIKVENKRAEFYLHASMAQRALGEKNKADALFERYVELKKSAAQPATIQAPNR
ncbi:MAG: protein phosphatase 2C domain-containing protein [Acidobacteriota bacterium]